MSHKMMVLCAAAAITLGPAMGCSSHTRTVTRETTQYSADRGPYAGDPARVSETETTTTETVRRDDPPGLVSGTVNVIGEAVALPFRAVGGMIRALF